ncbi:HAD-IA family hydrolase [Sneathiella sp. P13V-1]|uniref:HAD family hydrolase n=1 Tax=Sneathiella sp. P13V-1 TaxID=2697366 RepID=UPI00187B60E5|nr:HAD family phosphatase [Sneathiella sp. P13V-1]MBE7636022.1 HAD-IA family hydrolase [Sneathiella sp. P13V-1]
MKKAVIFDMDGLLLDTEVVALRTFQQVCDELGIQFDRAIYNKCLGRNLQSTEKLLTRELEGFETSTFMPLWTGLYHEEAVLRPVPTKEGVEDFLNALKNWDIPMAVATSSGQDKAASKLSNAGIDHFFHEVISGDMVENSKPDPEIYLKAAKAVGYHPTDCLALEDSDNGVKAAHSAGMLVFQIPDLVPPSPETEALGHNIVTSMTVVHGRFVPHTK